MAFGQPNQIPMYTTMGAAGMGNVQQVPQQQPAYISQPQQVPNWNRPMQNYNTLPQASIPGRMITNPQDIRPNEVPMDGTASLFPMNDFSCIYAKAWGPNGNIETLRFVPEKVEEPGAQPTQFDRLMEEMASIKQLILSKNSNKKPNYSNGQKKEGNTNGE